MATRKYVVIEDCVPVFLYSRNYLPASVSTGGLQVMLSEGVVVGHL